MKFSEFSWLLRSLQRKRDKERREDIKKREKLLVNEHIRCLYTEEYCHVYRHREGKVASPGKLSLCYCVWNVFDKRKGFTDAWEAFVLLRER